MTLKSQLWDEMLEEYCNRHRGGGLTWWQAPLEVQPQEFKAEMYDILWTILNKEEIIWNNKYRKNHQGIQAETL